MAVYPALPASGREALQSLSKPGRFPVPIADLKSGRVPTYAGPARNPSFGDIMGYIGDKIRGTYDSVKDKIGDKIGDLGDLLDDDLPDRPRPPAKHGSSGHSSAKRTWSYYEAPIAEYYGFGKETAYQEALANTAYRREMADMKKAGLNPSVIYGAHNSSGAESSIRPRSSGGGGGGGRGGRRYGRAPQDGISKTAYYGIQLAATGIGAMVGGRGGAFLGATVGRTAAQLIGSLF